MKKNAEMLEKVLFRAHVAFFGGLAVLIVCLLVLNSSVGADWVITACVIVGIVASFGGLLYAFAYFRCPHCSASLMPGGRMPMSIPAYCSSCGAKLSENE